MWIRLGVRISADGLFVQTAIKVACCNNSAKVEDPVKKSDCLLYNNSLLGQTMRGEIMRLWNNRDVGRSPAMELR